MAYSFRLIGLWVVKVIKMTSIRRSHDKIQMYLLVLLIYYCISIVCSPFLINFYYPKYISSWEKCQI
jgi:hypothetical protein